MITPNINYWYNEDRHIFIGWLFWGIDIVIIDKKEGWLSSALLYFF